MCFNKLCDCSFVYLIDIKNKGIGTAPAGKKKTIRKVGEEEEEEEER